MNWKESHDLNCWSILEYGPGPVVVVVVAVVVVVVASVVVVVVVAAVVMVVVPAGVVVVGWYWLQTQCTVCSWYTTRHSWVAA